MEFINRIYTSNSALRYAIDICKEKERYRVGIATLTEETKEQLLTFLRYDNDIEKITNSKYECRVYFKNGSLIRFMDTSGNTRGRRYHLLIVDKNISEDIMKCVILPCWMPYLFECQEDYNKLGDDRE